MADYLIPQKWKRFFFRRGYIPMGDVHDVVERLGTRIDEADKTIFKNRLSNIQNIQTPEFQQALEFIRKNRFDAFMKILGEETDNQWDRIVDRRLSNFIYSVLIGFLFTILGFVLGRL